MAASELWEARANSQLFHPGDSGEELILILQGRLESQGGRGIRRNWFQGELWGEERLGMPQPLEYALRTVEYTRWLRWTRVVLLELCSRSSMRRALKPRYDSKGSLQSGFSKSIQTDSAPRRSRRKIRPSSKPAIFIFAFAVLVALLLYIVSSGVEMISPLIVLCSPAVFLSWLCIFSVRNLSTSYEIEADSIISRRFEWRNLAIEIRHIPTNQIQGISIDQKGTMNQLLGIGTIRIKTAALEGELILRDIDSPNSLAREIQKLRECTNARMGGREREKMRRSLEDSGLGERRPRMLRSKQESRRMVNPTALKIRKSPIVLAGKILLPMTLGIISFLLPVSKGLHFVSFIPLFIWMLYRFEIWRNNYFLASQGYLTIFNRRPFGRNLLRHQIEISSLQNIRTEQRGIFPLIFGYGNVVLVTTGGASNITLEKVSKPQRIQEMIFRYRRDEQQRHEHMQSITQMKTLTQLAHALRQIQAN